MPTLNNNGVKFSKISQPSLSTTGRKISGSEYAVNEQGEIQHMNQNYIVNAIDIDWNNAEVTNILGPIKNTSDLIKNLADVKSEVNELKNNGGGTNNPSTSSATIGSNGNWFINGVDTGIKASEENGLTPYIKDNAWYIGDVKIFDIGGNNISLIPYEKNGTWWIGDTNTNIPVTQIVDTNYPKEKDGYWWVGDINTFIEVNPNEEPNITKNNEGHWEIYGIDTGITAEQEQQDQTPYYYNNAWYIGDTKIFDLNTITESITPYIKDGHWWVGDKDTGVAVSETTTNVNYPKEKDGYWWIGDTNTFIEVDPDLDPNIIKSDYGTWVIYDIDTGIAAEEEHPNLVPYMYNGSWYIGDTKLFNANEIVSNLDVFIKDGHLWIGNKDTGISIGETGETIENVNYPYIKDDYWWINDNNTYIPVDPNDEPNIIKNGEGHWEIYGIDTGISVEEEQENLVPYIYNGAWYIGDKKLFDINQVTPDLTPYVKNGTWWINGADTGIPVSESTNVNVNYPYIKDGYWWVRDTNTFIGVDPDIDPEISESEDGNWEIYGIDTGIPVEEEQPNLKPYMYKNAWYIGDTKVIDLVELNNNFVPYIKNGTWWIGNTDTGLKVESSQQNSNYPYEKDNFWWVGDVNTFIYVDPDIDPDITESKDGNWEIYGIDTGIPVKEETVDLTPYIFKGAWYIGDKKIIDINEFSNKLTPYIKDGYWYVGNNNTGIPAIGDSTTVVIGENGNWFINGEDTGSPASSVPYIKDGHWWVGNNDTGVEAGSASANTPYIGEDGYWYINGEKTDYQFNGEDGQTPHIKNGHWWIGDYDTGIEATASINNSSINIEIGEDGNWYINGKNTGKSAVAKMPEIEIGENGNWYINGVDTGKPSSGGVKQSTIEIGSNGNWFINGVDTGIIASGQNGLTPYERNGAWYIGDQKIIDIDESQNGLTPYIKDGYWWIGETNTGVKVQGKAGNSPYVGDDGYWYINGEKTEYQVSGTPGSDGQTPKIIDGIWWIGDYNTGITAIALPGTSSIITIGENGNWYINGEDTGYYAIINNGGGDENSIPIYDTETENKLKSQNALPDKYISLGDEYNDQSNTSLINHLFSVISDLQAEVNKLKNTFTRGIYSYNNDATFISSVVNNYGDEEEPMWAVDESILDNIDVFNEEHQINPSNLFEDLKNIEAARLYAYMTIDNIDIAKINLLSIDERSRISIMPKNYVNENNIRLMIIINRKLNDKQYPTNFCYISLYDNLNNSLINGYYDSGELSNNEINIDNTYCFESITGASDIRIYSQDKEIGNGNSTIEEIPGEDEDSYRVAHIAIRSVTNYTMLTNIKDKLVNNELVFDENKERLYIKINNKIIKIGASSAGDEEIIINPDVPSDNTDTMTNQEIIKALEDQGIITIKFKNNNITAINEKYAATNIDNYKFNKVGSVTFVNEDTGKTFEFMADAYGKLKGTLLDNEKSISDRLGSTQLKDDWYSCRGVIGQLGEKEYVDDGKGSTLAANKDHGLYADRIKIGAVYAPLNSDIVFGCSHAYVELENTSDKDFNLNGCYLTYIRPNGTQYIKSTLALTGTLYAGSTYLIRGKKYVKNDNDPNCFIHVDTYDQEWYDNKQLIDFTITKKVNKASDNTQQIDASYVFVLSYGHIINNDDLGTTDNDGAFKVAKPIKEAVNGGEDPNTATLVYPKGFIDAIAIHTNRYGITSAFTVYSNCIYKNTFELDPAKQAFNGLTTRDSSRQRWQNAKTDYMNLVLNKEYIEFHKTEEKYPVNYFTPKASFERKNVCTDKTKFNKEKPNAVTVGFGENIYTTRCFNWLSASNNDEYVWIYDSNNNLVGKFESYKYTDTDIEQSTSGICHRKEYPARVNNIIYCDYRENEIYDTDNKIKSSATSEALPKNVTYSEYSKANRACGIFAGSNDFYVSHKCVIEFNESSNVKKVYKYIVGQQDKYGNPLKEHCSETQQFTLYPESFEPRIYQITDQQGFHWIEYQVWAAAAIKVKEKIEEDITSNPNIIPIILNTGDCTQSGSRVNEWLDYFNAGNVLFKYYEQNNLVGNNDLNGTDVQLLGTGDDPGKSNGYYFYLFNCIDANNFFNNGEDHYPIANKTYIPSLYYIQTNSLRIVMMNSEITFVNCKNWFNLKYEGKTVNIYTGFTCSDSSGSFEKYAANNIEDFTPIYTLLWHALNKEENGNRKCIVACHEMPFTVITNESLLESASNGTIYPIQKYRSISNADKLVGSHLNQLTAKDDGAGIYWFSRLLEYMKVKICIGGHKHTYTSTYPLREFYKYYKNDVLVNSLEEGPMDMPETLESEEYTTLENRKVIWKWNDWTNNMYQWSTPSGYGAGGTEKDINFSKFPITYRLDGETFTDESKKPGAGKFYPVTIQTSNNYIDSAVIYVMSQATGYKLTSNKELPSENQKFSQIIPHTTVKQKDGKDTDTASNEQKYPMFIIYEMPLDASTVHIKLARVANIFENWEFKQSTYNKNPMALQWMNDKENNVNYDNFGNWVNNESYMIPEIYL